MSTEGRRNKEKGTRFKVKGGRWVAWTNLFVRGCLILN